MMRTLIRLFVIVGICVISLADAQAGGISVDAGLTPAHKKYILRSQLRIVQRGNDPGPMRREMTAYMYPLVAAYGVRSDLTVMVRQMFVDREMTMMGNTTASTGRGDLFLMGKYRLTRINTRKYTLGVAPLLGVSIPSGSEGFSSNSWDVKVGCVGSGRLGFWAADFNIDYLFRGVAKDQSGGIERGDEFSIQAAIARQIAVGRSAAMSLAPVLEVSYEHAAEDKFDGLVVGNTGESVLMLSPGVKFTWSSLVLESLAKIPIAQRQNGIQTEQKPTIIIGLRLMS